MHLLAMEAAKIGQQLTQRQLNQFEQYQDLLLVWNQRINLTAIDEPELIQIRHFLDAITCTTVTGDLDKLHLADVGAGAGFPGLPLKICFPRLSLTLIDSVKKKTSFLQEVVAELNLTDVTIINERAEVVGHLSAHRGQYDWVTARGVAELRVLAEYLLPLCRVGGKVLAQKGEEVEEELDNAEAAIRELGGAPPQVRSVRLPLLDRAHRLVIIEKVAPTPLKYPRRVGRPAKRPL